MPRGRHRQASPLHRLLLPLTVGGTAVVLAAGSLVVGDPVVLRVVAAAAAAAACAAAVLLRRWDQAAGKSVAEMKTARQRDEWRSDERIAELEVDLEDSHTLRGRLENKLRAKRAELARLRTGHADLLRRYATAESERARTLEDRRRLALDAGGTARSAAAQDADALLFPVDADAYGKAAEALRHLSRNGARQQAIRAIEDARRHHPEVDRWDRDERQRPQVDRGGPPTLPVRDRGGVSEVAAAVLPYSEPQPVGSASRAQGGFDFFGTAKKSPAETASGQVREEAREEAREEVREEAREEVREEDIADVVGDEAFAEHRASDVIDLTAHDETEQLDLRGLRTSGTP